ncbi:MAG: sodium:solute symporter [Planctomycetota bacterium]
MNLPIEPFDLVVFLVYLGLVMALGMWVGKGAKDLSSYLLGDRQLPWWAILGSIVATETSTVTFLSVPGIVFAEGGNMTFLQLSLGYILGRILVSLLLLPGYFQGKIFSAYELLEKHFGVETKRVASVIFLLARNFGDALRLFLTALVLEAMFDLSLGWSIVIIGVLTIAYTLVGGMKAVIWNDCLQLLVYMLGGVLIAFIIAGRLPEGWSGIVSFGQETGRLQVLDFEWDWTEPYTFWAGLIGGVFLAVGTHGVDQMLVQRYLAAKSRHHASAALITSGFVVALQFAFFLFLGVALAAYYHQPQFAEVDFSEWSGDKALATFIVEELPGGIGLIGFILAGVFAAAMSTLSSSLNSSATVVVNDFFKAKEDAPEEMLWQSRVWTAVFGVIQMVIAFAASGVTRSVVDEVLGIAGMTVGLLLGLFALSRIFPTCGQRGAIVGLLVASLILIFVRFVMPPVYGLSIAGTWYALIGSTSTVLIASLVHYRSVWK